jgi:acyl carrier protein
VSESGQRMGDPRRDDCAGVQVADELLRRVTARQLDVAPERIEAGTRLGEDLFLDSLAAMELLIVVEEELGIRLPEDLFAGISTYGEFAAAVSARAEPAIPPS